jgi:hypothetical protein
MEIFKGKSEVEVEGYNNRAILQHGEMTGHHHLLNCKGEIADLGEENKQYEGTDVFLDKLRIEDDAILTHHEHNPHKFEKGTYIKVIQVSYNPYARINVPTKD